MFSPNLMSVKLSVSQIWSKQILSFPLKNEIHVWGSSSIIRYSRYTGAVCIEGKLQIFIAIIDF